MAYLTDGMVGTDLTKLTAGTTTDGAGAEFALGTRRTGTDGTVWVYVQASAAITQYDCVAITQDFQAAPITDTTAGQGMFPGFAQVAFADNDMGWVAIEGTNIRCRVAASVAANAHLWSFTVSGVLEDASTAGAIEIHGVTTVTAASTATVDVEIRARAPFATWTDL